MNDLDKLKAGLKPFLQKHGIKFTTRGMFNCPFHDDKTESASIVPDSGGTVARCFACGENWDIFHFASKFYGLHIKVDFPEIKKRVEEELGYMGDYTPATAPKKAQDKPVTLSREAALAVYTQAAIKELGLFVFQDKLAQGAELKIETVYPCKNEAGEVEFIEARFLPSCFNDGQKRTVAMWWNGKRLKSKNNPHGIFGRELLPAHPDKPVLIVEGPKCQNAAKALIDHFVPVAWNGGANGHNSIDFSPLSGRRAYIYPDDDKPGYKMAEAVSKMLQGIASEVIIVEPLAEARKIKDKGADIVEALETVSPIELTEYILKHTQLAETSVSSDPYIIAGLFLAQRGFYKVKDGKTIDYYSLPEDQVYSYSEIRDKFCEDKINVDKAYQINPAKAAKMINNLDPAYPVYHLVKSFCYPPLYMGQNGSENEFIINRWKGFAYPLKKVPPSDASINAEAEFVKSHIKDIICGGSEEEYSYLCKWIAHMLQKPDIKPGTAVFAHSEAQGTGKSIIFEQLIPNMLGIDITRVFSNEEQIAEKFNAWLFENLYVVFSERSFYGNTENIKAWITDPNQSRRDMGAESKQERSFARFVICTNKENAFKFEKGERRMFVLSVSSKMVGNWDYFTRLGKAVNSAIVLDRLARFFCEIDISDFNTYDLPESDKKLEITKAELHPVIDFFEVIAYGEDKGCQALPCSEIDPYATDNYNKSVALYEAIKSTCINGEFFIERKRLFDRWKDTVGRARGETMNRFTRIIKNYYPIEKVEVLDRYIKEYGKTKKAPVIVIKQAFFENGYN